MKEDVLLEIQWLYPIRNSANKFLMIRSEIVSIPQDKINLPERYRILIAFTAKPGRKIRHIPVDANIIYICMYTTTLCVVLVCTRLSSCQDRFTYIGGPYSVWRFNLSTGTGSQSGTKTNSIAPWRSNPALKTDEYQLVSRMLLGRASDTFVCYSLVGHLWWHLRLRLKWKVTAITIVFNSMNIYY